MNRGSRTAAAAVLTVGAMLGATPSASADDGFLITSESPTLEQLNEQVRYIVETNASDEQKAANLEGGMQAVVVPRTVYQLGLFRAPRGWNEVTGPETHSGDRHTAVLHSGSVGRPTINMTVEWVRRDGVWKLANNSLCEGVKAVGLPIPCDFG